MEKETSSEDLWKDPEKAKDLLKKLNEKKALVERVNSFAERLEELKIYLEMAEQEEEGAYEEYVKEYDKLLKDIEDEETATLLGGEYDRGDAILSIHAGAGGTDAQDWAEMLLRMYMRWLDKKGFKTKIAETSAGEEAGIKSATVMVEGEYAFGLLKSEKGVHRLVRLSPFDAAHRRHTSFAQVDVVPQIEDNIDIEIKEEDLKIDTYRSSGAGGQHVNKTSSAVRITHIPTGIVVQCQNERSQHYNKATALKILKAKLFEREREERERKLAQLRGEHIDIGWGSQIRSYVLHPYTLVKDHRTGVEVGNVQGVLDGEIDPFIKGYLQWKTRQGSR